MTQQEQGPRNGESLVSREILVPLFGGITISGRSGTGKTVAMELLAQKYGIKTERKRKTGEIIREITQARRTSRGFMERSEEVDERVDSEQKQIIESASVDNPFILEGRLAGFLAAENPNVVKVLFVAKSEIRMRRIFKRALEDRDEEIGHLQKDLEAAYGKNADPSVISYFLETLSAVQEEEITLETVKKKEQERERGDLVRWRKTHPALSEVDPFNPANRDSNGRHIYNFVVNTNQLSAEQVVNQINKALIEEGFLETRHEEDIFPKNAVVFQS